jgi:hypothetical protein
MFKSALSSISQNKVESRRTVVGSMDINYDSIQNIIANTLVGLTPEDATKAKTGIENMGEILAQAQEAKDLQKRLAGIKFS